MNLKVIRYRVGEYVKDKSNITGVESSRATLTYAHKGTLHKLSAKHLLHYRNEFADRLNIRKIDRHDIADQFSGREKTASTARGNVGGWA